MIATISAQSAPLLDAIGVSHAAADAQARIICLVPSITELLCDLGLTNQLVGRTGFCIHPRETVKRVPKLGGTKCIDIAKARTLAATHVIVNVEENRKEDVDALAEFIANVIVTYPVSPQDNLGLYRLLGGVFDRVRQAETLCRKFTQEMSRLEAETQTWPRQNVLYVIWKEPWMTVSRDTYISRMLTLVGWDTMPADAATRWPEVGLNGDALNDIDLILLSTEPFPFREKHLRELRKILPAEKRIALIDGEMTSWYGSRAIPALDYLGQFRRLIEK